MTPEQAAQLADVAATVKWNTTPWAGASLNALQRIEPLLNLVASKVDVSPEELAQIKAAASAGAADAIKANADSFAAAVVAKLPAGVLTKTDVEQAVRDAFAGGLAS